MMLQNIAVTRAVNPVGVEPKLTAEQMWKGLELKIKNPELFIPIAVSAETTTKEGSKMIRNMKAKNGEMIKEIIEVGDGAIIYFDGVDTRRRITNILSYNENLDLLLTFTFVGGIPGSNLGENATIEELSKIAAKGVEETITQIRNLVLNGTIRHELGKM